MSGGQVNNPPPNDKSGEELVASHAELIGRVTVVWNDVHRQVGQLFEDFCASAEARDQYWDIQNDSRQRRRLLSEGTFALQEYPDLYERLEKTLAAIDDLAQDRNATIHTYWAIDLPAGKILAHRQVPSHKSLRPDFEEQFNELLKKLSDQWRSLWNLRIDYSDRKAGLPAATKGPT
jgi:hypothetical protein